MDFENSSQISRRIQNIYEISNKIFVRYHKIWLLKCYKSKTFYYMFYIYARGYSKITSSGQGGGGVGVGGTQNYWQKVTYGGGEYMQIVTSSLKKIMYKFLLFVCFWSVRQQLSFVYHSDRGVVSSTGLSPRTQSN